MAFVKIVPAAVVYVRYYELNLLFISALPIIKETFSILFLLNWIFYKSAELNISKPALLLAENCVSTDEEALFN